jgi:hypothetical protein
MLEHTQNWLFGPPCLLLLLLQVFLQRSAVNLLGVVLDVPEFFWSAPDHLQVSLWAVWWFWSYAEFVY